MADAGIQPPTRDEPGRPATVVIREEMQEILEGASRVGSELRFGRLLSPEEMRFVVEEAHPFYSRSRPAVLPQRGATRALHEA